MGRRRDGENSSWGLKKTKEGLGEAGVLGTVTKEKVNDSIGYKPDG